MFRIADLLLFSRTSSRDQVAPPTSSVQHLESRVFMDASPVATLVGQPELVSGAYVVRVHYTDDSAIDSSTIDGGDVYLVGADGSPIDSQLVNLTRRDDGSFEAEYSVPYPSEAGRYTFAIRDNQVSDDTGNFVPAGTLADVRVKTDRRGPVARLTSGPTLSSPGQYTFEITYTDNVGIDNDSIIDTQAVRIVGPGGFDQPAELQSIVTTPEGVKRVTYGFAAPTEPGRYRIVIAEDGVRDVSGNTVRPQKLGSFEVTATE